MFWSKFECVRLVSRCTKRGKCMSNQAGMNHAEIKKMILVSFFIALEIIFVRFLHFMPIGTLRFDFGFIPVVLCALLFGPVTTGMMAVIANVIGVNMFSPFPMNPGLTFSSFLSAVIYGYFLHNRKVSLARLAVACFIVSVFINLILDTFWLSLMLGEGYLGLLPGRIVRAAWFFVKVPVLYILWRTLEPHIKRLQA